jgi:hypothetical protein
MAVAVVPAVAHTTVAADMTLVAAQAVAARESWVEILLLLLAM